jgi:hypothetical protein
MVPCVHRRCQSGGGTLVIARHPAASTGVGN